MHWIKEKIIWFHWSMDPKTTWLTVHPVASWYFSHGWEFCQTLEPKYWTFLSFLCANECEYLVEWTSSNSSRKKKEGKNTLCKTFESPFTHRHVKGKKRNLLLLQYFIPGPEAISLKLGFLLSWICNEDAKRVAAIWRTKG